MSWKKLGLVKAPARANTWQHSHAYTPTPIRLNDEIFRIFVSFLDKKKVGRVGFVDVSAQDPTTILNISETPSLDIGEPGAFDDNGVTPVSVVRDGDDLRLYYIGWQLCEQVRYMLFVGLAASTDNGETFSRIQKVPILERSQDEMIVRTAANVMCDQDLWRMWYIAGSETILVNGKVTPTYSMKYAESKNGIDWPSEGKLIMSPQGSDEYGFGRPYVLNNDAGFEMWYSIRSHTRGYHIGYATSSNGIDWARKDDIATLEASTDGWDSEMIAFGGICDSPDHRFIFYNGNGFGRDGFGVAEWISD